MKGVCSALGVRDRTACETAGESEGNIGLFDVIESDFSALPNSVHPSNSGLGSSSSACARRVACAHLLLCLLLLHMRMRRSCTVLAIQVVLVSSCLCRGPPVTAWIIRGRTRVGFRVPRAQRLSKVGFPVRPKIFFLSQRWRQG